MVNDNDPKNFWKDAGQAGGEGALAGAAIALLAFIAGIVFGGDPNGRES